MKTSLLASVRRARTLFLLLPLAACAHHRGQQVAPSQAARQAPPTPPQAAQTPDGLPPSDLEDPAGMPDVGASLTAPEQDEDALGGAQLLERAFTALQADEPAAALASLQAAVATGELNDAGRTLAYWHIYTAEQAMGHGDAARDALADFVAASSDLLAEQHAPEAALDGRRDFIERFDLAGRVARSRALLSLAWARENAGFGRSRRAAVPVRSRAEMDYFIALAPPCAGAAGRHIEHATVGAHRRVDVTCRGRGERARFFFELSANDAASEHAANTQHGAAEPAH